jgi:hypothetical protein
MKKFLLAAAALILVAGTAFAGPNAGGTLIMHNTGLEYTSDIPDYCGLAPLGLCDDAVVRDDSGIPTVWSVYAAFPGGSSPALKAVTFGIEYDAAVYLLGLGKCGDFEVTTGAWPESGEGTGMTFNVAQNTLLVELYWFGGYAYGPPMHFGLIPHPTQGGTFADDSVPAIIDDVVDFGVLGFLQDGYLPCPTAPEPGACCDEFGYCTITLPDDCQGVFVGGACDPNPCDIPFGACCTGPTFEICIVTDYITCVDVEMGVWKGDPTCDPDPCIPIPTQEGSWGSIKATYR